MKLTLKTLTTYLLLLVSHNALSKETFNECAKEGQWCTPRSTNSVIAYGGDKIKYYYYVWGLLSNGNKSIWCGDDLGGKPQEGAKNCGVAPRNNRDILHTTVINENDTKYPESSTIEIGESPRWVHYGIDGRYWSAIYSDEFKCGNWEFYDLTIGPKKSCILGGKVFGDSATVPDWSHCGDQYSQCVIPRDFMTLVRYGNPGKWVYRIASSEQQDASIYCNDSSFDYDPDYGRTKRCEYIQLNFIGTHKGIWEQIDSLFCSAGIACSITREDQFGTDYQNITSSSEEWRKAVQFTTEAGFDIETLISLKASSQTGLEYSRSSNYETALTTTRLINKSYTCPAVNNTEAGDYYMYQFETIRTIPTCNRPGTCSAEADTNNLACIFVPASSARAYPGPQCFPGHCADSQCLTCK